MDQDLQRRRIVLAGGKAAGMTRLDRLGEAAHAVDLSLQSVASSTEEMNAAVHEISRNVHRAVEIAAGARRSCA